MKMLSNESRLLVVAALVALVTACGGKSGGNSSALKAIAVSPATATVAKGFSQSFVAMGTYADGTTKNITAEVVWSSDVAAASFSTTAGEEGIAKGGSAGSVTITAKAQEVQGTASLTVSEATLRSIAIDPATASVPRGVAQAFKATGTFSDSTTADISADVTWASGDAAVASVSNAVATKGQATGIAVGGPADIIAAKSGVSGQAKLSVTKEVLGSVTVTPAKLPGDPNTTVTGTVTLTAAPAADATVTLSSDSQIAVPTAASVIVLAGTTQASFTVGTIPVTADTTVTLTGTYGVSHTATLLITAPVPASLQLSPKATSGANGAGGTVTLDGPAPAGGTIVTLASDNAAATVPATIDVPAGSNISSWFAVTTTVVPTETTVNISGSVGATTKSASLSISTLRRLNNNGSIVCGNVGTGTVTLTGAAPAGGTTVAITSSNTFVAAPPTSVTVPAGSTFVDFNIPTATCSPGASFSVDITATLGGYSRMRTINVWN